MHVKKRQSVMALPAEQRFDYFVRKVVDFEEVWGLFEDGWVMVAAGEGKVALPFWPEADFATACADGVWAKCEPKMIPLEEFLARWIPGMIRDRRLIAIFPTDQDKGVLASPESVMSAIQIEQEKYSDE